MGKAYLKYEQVAGFGVVASSTAAVRQVRCSKSSTPFVASATVDILTIWNARTGEAVARFGNAATRKAGAITALAVSAGGDTIACGYTDGSIRIWTFSVAHLTAAARGYVPDDEDDGEVARVFSPAGNEPAPAVTFNGHRSGISALAFEQDATTASDSTPAVPTTLVSGSNDGDIILWNVVEANGVFRINAHADAVTAVAAFRPDDDAAAAYVVSASKDTLVKVFDADTQHCIQTIAHCHAEAWAVHVDIAARLLFVGSVGAEVRLYALMSKTERDARQEERERKRADGKNTPAMMDDLLAYDNESIFKPLGFAERAVATDRVVSIESIAHAGERYVVLCAADKTAELFRLRSDDQAQTHRKRREKRKMASIEREVKGIGEDEGWDSAKIEQTVKERQSEVSFEIEAVDYMVSIRQIRMRKKLRSIIFLSPTTYLASDSNSSKGTGGGGGIELQLLVQLKDNALEVHSLTISGSKKNKKRKKAGKSILDDNDGEQDGGTTRSMTDEIKKLVTLDFAGHRNDVRSISLSPEESTLLSTSDGALKLWNIATQKCIRSMGFSGYGLCTQFIGADGMIGVVGAKSGMVEVYELGSGTLITQEQAHEGEVWSMCLDDHIYDAKCLITGGADKRVCFWGIENILTGRRAANADDDDDDEMKLELTRVLEMPDQVLCVRVAHERKRPCVLVSMMDSSVRAYFLDSLEPYLNFYGHRLPVMSMDVSSDGLMLVTGSADKSVKLWGMDFGDCRRSLRGHSDSVLSVAFQPKTHYVFSGSRDGVLKYWDADNFQLICDIEGQRGEVWSLALSMDGEVVATASHDRFIRVWRRTDEPLFLDEERDRRMDEMFEAKLIEDDVLQASKSRKDDLAVFQKTGDEDADEQQQKSVGFMYDEGKAESSSAGKRSMDSIKGCEMIMEAVQMCDEEKEKVAMAADKDGDGGGKEPVKMNPLLLGLSPDAYMLRCLERIRHADLEQTLQMLPLHVANRLIEYLCVLLAPEFRPARLAIEHLTRAALFLVRYHHAQMCAGAVPRKTMAELQRVLTLRCEQARERFAVNHAALHFWKNELANRDDRPFRDARARAYNIELAKRDKARKASAKRVGRKRKAIAALEDAELAGIVGEQ